VCSILLLWLVCCKILYKSSKVTQFYNDIRSTFRCFQENELVEWSHEQPPPTVKSEDGLKLICSRSIDTSTSTGRDESYVARIAADQDRLRSSLRHRDRWRFAIIVAFVNVAKWVTSRVHIVSYCSAAGRTCSCAVQRSRCVTMTTLTAHQTVNQRTLATM